MLNRELHVPVHTHQLKLKQNKTKKTQKIPPTLKIQQVE